MASDSSQEQADLPTMEVFYLLKLAVEAQNDVAVVKPVLVQEEVLRLATTLSMSQAATPEDFSYNFFGEQSSAQEFVRYLRTEIFGKRKMVSDNGTTMEKSVSVLSIFGKQLDVKQELTRLGCWNLECDETLEEGEMGIYAAMVHRDINTPDPPIVFFSWLQDDQFEREDFVRGTASYILRFLTSLSDDLICCLSERDCQEVSEIVDRVAMGGDMNDWVAYSVTFHVECEEEEKDSVVSTAERVISSSNWKDALELYAVQGKFAGIATVNLTPEKVTFEKSKEYKYDEDKLVEWLINQANQYCLKVKFDKRTEEKIRDKLLVAAQAWPNVELKEIRDKYEQLKAYAVEDCKDELVSEMNSRRESVFLALDELFDVKALPELENESVKEALKTFNRLINWMDAREHSPFKLKTSTRVTLQLPLRLPHALKDLLDLLKNEHIDAFQSYLEQLPSKRRSEISVSHLKNESFLASSMSSIWSYISRDKSTQEMMPEFEFAMREPLSMWKTMWKEAAETIFAEMLTNLPETQALPKCCMLERNCEDEVDATVNDAFRIVISTWGKSSKPIMEVDIKDTMLGTYSTCNIKKERVEPPKKTIEVFQFKPLKQLKQAAVPLGKLPFTQNDQVLGLYSARAFVVIAVSIRGERTLIHRMDFSPGGVLNQNESAKLKQIRSLGRKVDFCDFSIENRTIALVDNDGHAQVYRFNDQFTSMESTRSVNLGANFSLDDALAGTLLLNNVLYAYDSKGSFQSIDLRSQQVGRKGSISEDKLQSLQLGNFFKLPGGLVIGCLTQAKDEENTSALTLKAFAAEDSRLLPTTVHGDVGCIELEQHHIVCDEDNMYVVNYATKEVHVHCVDITIRSDSYRIRDGTDKTGTGDDEVEKELVDKAKHWMYAFYHLFEKFPVKGLLDSPQPKKELRIAAVCPAASSGVTKGKVKDFLEYLMLELHKLNKPFSGLDLGKHFLALNMDSVQNFLDGFTRRIGSKPIGSLLVSLITFVPVQICRAEDNTLTVLTDGEVNRSGLEKSQSTSMQASDIARSMHFGLLSPLLQAWKGKCVVVSSMGKQSTGKSYFLNHLTGSSFAIAGARCTDGVWMTVRMLQDNMLLVVLDFEGLGSFERTEQEDVFLSVLNAAISMFTIFRMEMRFDKEIDGLFSKFQKGVKLLKNDPQLFQGKLYMSVKDVNPSDQAGVLEEFRKKFGNLLRANREDNFLTALYSGQLDINSSPPLGTMGYYKSMAGAQQSMRKMFASKEKCGFNSGNSFLQCLQLILAKISILDWTSLDDSAQKMIVDDLSAKLPGVIRTGCIIPFDSVTVANDVPDYLKEELETGDGVVNLSLLQLCEARHELVEQWQILNLSIALDEVEDSSVDFHLDYSTAVEKQSVGFGQSFHAIFKQLQSLMSQPANGKLSTEMQHDLDVFISFLVFRRKHRIEEWAKSVLGNRFQEVWKELEPKYLGWFQTVMTRCTHQCASCQLECMQSALHRSTAKHDCGLNHKCKGRCEYCAMSEGAGKCSPCSKEAGHIDVCECDAGDHTCGQECCMSGSPNCGKRCTLKAGHSELHHCAVKVHTCGEPCGAATCAGRCILNVELPHSAHKCAEVRCIEPCLMEGCNEKCASSDHFHGQAEISITYAAENAHGDPSEKELEIFDGSSAAPAVHMCSRGHPCSTMCGEKGICNVEVHRKKTSKTFAGARGTFEYTYQEMNGQRKKCAIMLAPGQQSHQGVHTCIDSTSSGTPGDTSVHYCDKRCPSCSYFCEKEHGHAGLHQTTHGNMRNTFFLADTDDIDIEERKYKAGETGIAEMCNLYCTKMGRAHVHYLECDQEESNDGRCTWSAGDKRRHCQRELEPKPEKEMDEVLHEKFWETLGWEDPVLSATEREEFGKCAYKCDAPAHEDKQSPSCCVLPAWHDPVTTPAEQDGFSYIGGHKFECSHVADGGKLHHVFVLDSSGSMQGWPWEQLLAAYQEYVYNRIATGTTQDLVSVVTFDHKSEIVYEGQNITAMANVHIQFRSGGTSYAAGLRSANEVISRIDFESYKPVVVFFSDGEPRDPIDGESLAAHIESTYNVYGLQSFVVGYGRVNLAMLRSLAEKLGGQYFSTLTGSELKSTFHTISASLSTRAGLALTKPIHETNCPICQKDLPSEETVALVPCSHELHRSCFTSMEDQLGEDRKLLCPACRTEVAPAA